MQLSLEERVATLEALMGVRKQEPRHELVYVADLACDGTEEIRWPSPVGASSGWGRWHRVTASKSSALGQSYRYLCGPEVALHVDHAVQVRRIDADGPFIRGAA